VVPAFRRRAGAVLGEDVGCAVWPSLPPRSARQGALKGKRPVSMPCDAVPCRAMAFCITPYAAMPRCAAPWHGVSRCVTSCHAVPCDILTHSVMLCPAMRCPVPRAVPAHASGRSPCLPASPLSRQLPALQHLSRSRGGKALAPPRGRAVVCWGVSKPPKAPRPSRTATEHRGAADPPGMQRYPWHPRGTGSGRQPLPSPPAVTSGSSLL